MTIETESREVTPFPAEGGLKLAFNKTVVDKLKAKPTNVKTHIQEQEAEKQYVTSLNEHKLGKLAAGPAKKSVVIPMLTKNVWKPEHLHTLLTGENPTKPEESPAEESETKQEDSNEPKTLEQEAIEALKQETRKKAAPHEVQAIPLLVANAVPGLDNFGDEDSKFKHDLELRPDDVEMDAYDRVSIDDFGKGMLLGMGWRPGKQDVEPIEFISRPGRLGLGANPSDLLSNKRPKKYTKPGESEPEIMRLAPGPDGKVRHFRKLSERLIPVHSKKVKVGSLIEVLMGPLARCYGRVQTVGEEEECEIVMNLSEQTVTMKRAEFDVLDEHALPKDHPAFKTAADIEREKAKEKALQRKRERSPEPQKVKSERPEKQEKQERRSEKPRDDRIKWLYPGLVVRVASQSLGNGRFFNKKGTVEDVVSLTQFSLVMEDGQLVEDAKERHVQTALPKVGGVVRVVQGPNKGVCGTLLERNSSKELATIQLDSDDMSIVQEAFDNVCEFKRRT